MIFNLIMKIVLTPIVLECWLGETTLELILHQETSCGVGSGHNSAIHLYPSFVGVGAIIGALKPIGGTNNTLHKMWWPNSTISLKPCPLRTTGFLPIVVFFDEIWDALVGLYVMVSTCNTLWPFYNKIWRFFVFEKVLHSLKVASCHWMVYVTCYNTSPPPTSTTSKFYLVYSS